MARDTEIQHLYVKRRTGPHLPSRRRHFLLACLFLLTIIAALAAITLGRGRVDDAISKGDLAIAPPPMPEPSDSLNGQSDALPDLLAGEVAMGENPTEALDALGNPVDPNRNPEPNSPIAGAVTQKPVTPLAGETSAVNQPGAPKTILIDGSPISTLGADALPPAPIPGLSGAGTFGLLPKIGPNGERSVTHYNRPFKASPGKKPVSVIIGGLGVNRGVTQRAIDTLPADVTLAFAAHSRDLQGWINKARAAGHEVLLEIPMESADFNAAEPGANRTLMASRNSGANKRNLEFMLSRAQGYYGIINYNGDVFLTRADQAAPVLDRLSKTGLGFIFDGASQAPSLKALSASASLPYAQAYNLLDLDRDKTKIQGELSRLANHSKSEGRSIGVGFAFPETVESVAEWTRTLDAKGLVLAPASFTLK